MLPLSTNIRDAYKNGKDEEQYFIQNLALFLCTFLKEHGLLIEHKSELQNNLLEVTKNRLEVRASGGCGWSLGPCGWSLKSHRTNVAKW